MSGKFITSEVVKLIEDSEDSGEDLDNDNYEYSDDFESESEYECMGTQSGI
jgi:hypothetical protein